MEAQNIKNIIYEELQIPQEIKLGQMSVSLYDLEKIVDKISSRLESQVGVPKPNQLNEQTLWQTCPKCNGQGWMSKPSWVAGDINEWTSTGAMHVCDICWGAKIIQTPKSL